MAVVVLLVPGLVIVETAGISVQKITFECDASGAVHDIVDGTDRENPTNVAVRSEYAVPAPFTAPHTVTVAPSDVDPAEPPPLALACKRVDGGNLRTAAVSCESGDDARVLYRSCVLR